MELFGKDVKLRTHYCKYFDKEIQEVEETYALLYVRQKGCNAKCLFCEYQNDAENFNEDKFYAILDELKDKVWVKKVSFSGGEPTLHLDKLARIIKKTRVALPGAYIVVNTNGVNLDEVFEDKSLVAIIDNFSISRHHYDDDKNNEIFGTKTISSENLKKLRKNIKKKSIFHLSCNLVKGYIDNKDEIYQFLEYANWMKMRSVGFVSLMPINDFCKDSFIDFNGLDLLSNRFMMTQQWTYEDICRCNNYIYITNDYEKIIKVYYKNTYRPECININLTFDGENLRNGFNDNIIY